ncbi:acyltransferase family protein [Propionicimonas sp.]|uniref:acyltransferase family protein n=1 Tax=Propionicimonas sp. TaxID=1955623 RepID=UPI0039E71B99
MPIVGRIRALDGLRGLAALVVLLHHTLLIFPALAYPYVVEADASATTDPWSWALLYTPVHILWEGQSAVYLFFVLSGIVLTLPVLSRGDAFDWRAYFPQRLLRLYLPVWGAVLLGVLVLVLVPRSAAMSSLWLQSRAVSPDPWAIVLDATLLVAPGGVVSPLWSLQWEILFSLLLPLYVLAAVRLRRAAPLLVVFALAMVVIGHQIGIGAVRLLPMFLLGVVVATRGSGLARRSVGGAPGVLLVVGGGLLLLAPWLLRPVGLAPTGWVDALSVLGALMLVCSALVVAWLKRLLSTRLVQWLGAISFSLYLVHEPVVISLAFLLGDQRLWLAAPLGIGASIALAVIFRRLIEVPSHRLARWVGAGVRDRAVRRAALPG